MTDWLLLQNSLFHQLYILTVGNCLEIIKKGIYRYAWCDEKLSIDWPGYLPQLQTLDRLVKQCIQCGLFQVLVIVCFVYNDRFCETKRQRKWWNTYPGQNQRYVDFFCVLLVVFLLFVRFLFSLLFYRNISAFFS